ncbi:hypothetical protein A2773_00765 [Candidatus Gottesmanbacteria bacterium RIFCSPHIGHO2_01_FULL_39_10]|uniref:Uncharacterized protein n=1 Tax=Candidatus Gottesmanbacteria bacterium RIFCSPHIGHO2_01_FULL_39_10 TaxID=1798375 RepID=A0A1F5ZLE1_9BACT|nr:MAG: hypothetical protein A2773_00765 [Candidatus Gottesmanbacteria bacterium RIFCSPHIGHO2_01_FULL_39_10]
MDNSLTTITTPPPTVLPVEVPKPSIPISKYTHALIKRYKEGAPVTAPSNVSKISVSQTVSFAAFLYEKMRNAIEYREDHLIRRAAIERILRRRIVLNPNGHDIAEPLIKELLWARYLENNVMPEDKIAEIQSTIDKYFYLKNEFTVGRPSKEQKKLTDWIIEVASCEIEERLSPDPRREAFTNYVYHLLRDNVRFLNGEEMERDVTIYIAVERAFAKSDDPLIRYHLLKLLIPDFIKGNWQDAQTLLPSFGEIYNKIEKDLAHPFLEQLRRFVKRESPPFLILRDLFEMYPKEYEAILENEEKLMYKIDEICRKRYDETRSKLRRAGVRSFIYIVLTKVIFALALELPYDIYILKSISYLPIVVNILVPPAFMSAIILSVGVPGPDNTKRIQTKIKQIITEDPDIPQKEQNQLVLGKKAKVKSPLLNIGFTFMYILAFLLSFGAIIFILSKFHFNIVSQGIFIFFLTLVTFFAYRIRLIAREYLVLEKEGVLEPIFDFFMLPLLRVGQWLSGEITKINLFIFIFDFVIEAPFKAIFEVVEEWIRFVKSKKEEMV